MQNGDDALPSISLAGIGQLVTAHNFNSMVYFEKNGIHNHFNIF